MPTLTDEFTKSPFCLATWQRLNTASGRRTATMAASLSYLIAFGQRLASAGSPQDRDGSRPVCACGPFGEIRRRSQSGELLRERHIDELIERDAFGIGDLLGFIE
jgi:hypothetical protein